MMLLSPAFLLEIFRLLTVSAAQARLLCGRSVPTYCMAAGRETYIHYIFSSHLRADQVCRGSRCVEKRD